MLMHCDFVYASETAKFQMPFINLALVPEFGSSCTVPASIGHIRAAELILLGLPFDAKRAADLEFVTQVVADQNLFEDGHRYSAKIGSEAGQRAASKQEAYEAEFSRTDQGGHEGRERRVQRASAL
jgi:enoyl-CoA hydratase/carnithine racemase